MAVKELLCAFSKKLRSTGVCTAASRGNRALVSAARKGWTHIVWFPKDTPVHPLESACRVTMNPSSAMFTLRNVAYLTEINS